jgi:hypothetical protein
VTLVFQNNNTYNSYNRPLFRLLLWIGRLYYKSYNYFFADWRENIKLPTAGGRIRIDPAKEIIQRH